MKRKTLSLKHKASPFVPTNTQLSEVEGYFCVAERSPEKAHKAHRSESKARREAQRLVEVVGIRRVYVCKLVAIAELKQAVSP